MKYWTNAEFNYLQENWKKQTKEEIAKHLGRSVRSLSAKGNELGLTRKIKIAEERKATPLNQSQIDSLPELLQLNTVAQIADLYGITTDRLYKHMRKHSIKACISRKHYANSPVNPLKRSMLRVLIQAGFTPQQLIDNFQLEVNYHFLYALKDAK